MAGKAAEGAAAGEQTPKPEATPGGEQTPKPGEGEQTPKPGEGEQTPKPGEGEGGKGKEGEKGGKGEGDGKGGKGSEAQGAPEKYELTIPDDGILDERDRTAIEAYARAQGLSNEDAQALLEEHAGQLRTQSETWLNETKTDKTYGGDKLPETQKLARAAIDRIRPEGHPRRDQFRALLNKGGIMNHLEVVSFLADLGRMMGEDGGVAGGAGGGKKKSLEDKLYTHPTSKVETTDE